MSYILTSLCFVLGVIKILNIIYDTYGFISRKLSTGYDLTERYGKGTWVIHTGSSDGIGAYTCKSLARLGFNLVMISRTESKLKKVEASINKECPNIQTRTMVRNFADEQSLDYYRQIYDAVKDLEISQVVINAGTMHCGTIEEKGKILKRMFDTNMYHMTMMHKMFLPHLLKRTAKKDQDKHCAIINVASASGVRPFPTGLNPYSASKAYNRNLSLSIIEEVRALDGTNMPDGAKSELIDIQVICPSGSNTNIVKSWAQKLLTPGSDVNDAIIKDWGKPWITFGVA